MKHYEFLINPDESFRRLERAAAFGDVEAEAQALVIKLRTGLVSRERVAMAAALGHPAASMIISPEEMPDLPDDNYQCALEAVKLLTQSEAVLWASDVAEITLKYWNSNDPRPTGAIAAAREWSMCPCEEHREMVQEAWAPAWALPLAPAWAAGAKAAGWAAAAAMAAAEGEASYLAPPSVAATEAARAAAESGMAWDRWLSMLADWLVEVPFEPNIIHV